MGRPKKDIVWQYYQEMIDKSIKCRFCEKTYKQKHVTKMAKHLMICNKAPFTVKKQMNDIEKRTSTESNENTNTVSELSAVERKENLSEDFAKALFISGAPMSMVDHQLWKFFFEKLNFRLPSRKALASRHLEKIYNETSKKLTDEIAKSPFFHIQCDGWSNIRNEGIINFLISKPEIVFVKSLNTEHNRHTSEYLAAEIEKVIKTYNEKKTVVIIGDNARNLQKSFEILKRKYPWVVTLGCAAHSLNLLCADTMKVPVIKACIDLATEVIKCIKRSQVLTALLNKIRKDKEINGETLKLPCKTRWGSHVAALKSLKVNKAALQILAVHEHNQPTSNVKATILDDGFWTMVDQCVSLMEPITQAILELEGNDYNICKVYMVFKDISSKLQFAFTTTSILETTNVECLMTAIEHRTAQVVKPIHYAAHMLNPKSEGHELTQNQEMEAMEFIYDLANFLNLDCLVDLAQYKGRDGLWGKEFTWKAADNVDAVLWWKGICGSSPLSKVALRILTAPCTSAATERSFSTHGFIHSAKRNRLTTERAAKISFLAYNWNLTNSQTGNLPLANVPNSDSDIDDTFSDDDDDDTQWDFDSVGVITTPDNPQPSTSSSTNRELEFVDVVTNNLSDDDD